eukprot:CAMPEP_0204359660 /NCGR_PEP_ID=MMETSP0469-20131031/37429_1 /ASSEMBLY_ACC=CAM_ASM_000384 /TAXON_ID=2969 /ORGANISM="Oxyrrhis marina" /LENGTH=387 /DNA_ID=CAMNT_0051347739 /DNA_START=13 /DNA_END=1174 /DNA_ORIENTATION=-
MAHLKLPTPQGVVPVKATHRVLEYLGYSDRAHLQTTCRSYHDHVAKYRCLQAFYRRLIEARKELNARNNCRARSVDFDLQQCINAQQVTQSWLDLIDGLLAKLRVEMMRRQSACAGFCMFRLCCPTKSRPEVLLERVQMCQRILERARALQVVEMQLGNALQVDECKRKDYCDAIKTSVARSLSDVQRGTWLELRLHFLDSIVRQRTMAIENMLRELAEGKYHQAYLDLQAEISEAQVALSEALPLGDLLPAPIPGQTKAHKTNHDCTICLSPADQDTVCLTCCKQVVHRDCISRWLVCNGPRCPLCRSAQLQDCIEATMLGGSDTNELRMYRVLVPVPTRPPVPVPVVKSLGAATVTRAPSASDWGSLERGLAQWETALFFERPGA